MHGSPRRVLVTGADGFVGSHATRALAQGGWKVVGTSRTGAGGLLPLDLADAEAVRGVFTRVPPIEAVVHLAAIAHRKRRGITDAEYDAVNRRGTELLLEAARRAGVPRFVFASSAAVYRPGDTGPLAEDAECAPAGAYGASKRRAELACLAAAAEGYPCVVLRFPAIYAREWFLDVRKRAYVPGTGGRLVLRVPGRQPEYSLCAIEHAVEAITMAVEGRLAPGAWNVADERPYTQREVAGSLALVDGRKPALPVPRGVLRAVVGAAGGIAPARVRAALGLAYTKLFEGQVLDVTRIHAAGLRSRTTLRETVARAAAGGEGRP